MSVPASEAQGTLSRHSSSWRTEVRQLTRLALPVAVVQVGMMAMGVVDTMMVGRVSEVDLAAVHIGHAYSFFFLALGMGLLMALDPLVSQAWGARDEEGITRSMQRGFFLALAVSGPIALAVLPAERALTWLGQAPEVIPIAAAYARWVIPGAPFFLLFVVLRHTLQAMHIVRPITWTILVANGANALFNWALVFGHLGFEPHGAVGAAWATSLCRAVMFAALLIWSWPVLGARIWPLRAGLVRAGAGGSIGIAPMLRVGTPIALQVGAEVGAFGVLSLLIGRLGATATAGSSIVLNLASVSFMLPLGISVAASVRVGNAVGRGDAEGVRRSARVALILGPGVMVLFGVLFLTVPGALAGLYSPDAAVVAVAASLLPIAACFQVFDGLQVTATGVLRGVADTRVPLLVHLAGFWIVAIPLGAWLGLGEGRRDPAGIWWGMTAGLVTVALVMLLRVRSRLSGPLERVAARAETSSGAGSVSASPSE